jgi:hypothetical protein
MNLSLSTAAFVTVMAISALGQPNDSTSTSDENGFSWGIENDLSSRNFYQGMILSESAVTQPCIWISFHDFTLSEWSNILLTDKDGRGVDESEFILDYEHEFNNLTLAPTLVLYYFPRESSDRITSELNLKISYKLGIFSLFTDNTIDFATFAGAYYGDLGGQLSFEFSDKFSAEATAAICWASPYYNEINWELESQNGWTVNSFSAEISSTYYVLDFLYLKPHIGAVTVIDKSLKEAAYSESAVFGGLIFGLEF